MSTLAFSHVSFQGKRSTRLPSRAKTREFPSRWEDTDSSPSNVPDAELARRTLAWCGIDPDSYRAKPLMRRLPACLRALEARTEDEALRFIDTRTDARRRALDALLISVTAFFRDAAVFDHVERLIVPALAVLEGRLRVWSAGCASGAELYSVGVLLGEAGLLGRSELVGTDCRAEAIRQSSQSVFEQTVIGAVAADRLLRFFQPAAHGTWRATDALRAHAAWRVADIARETEPGPWNVILWRNMAIYLRAGPAVAIARRLVAELAPGGFVVVGKAERLPADLGLRRVGPCVYQRTGCGHVA
jgi:chemotaxis methyl-accepting protein methylase